MSEWPVTVLPGLTALALVVGLGVTRTPRARSVLVLLVACVCAVMSVLHDQAWARTAYLVLAVASAYGSGRLWSRPRQT